MSVEKCQGCAYLNPIMFHCGKYLRGIETAVYLCDTAKPQTNADRIRAMTDEEMAEFFYDGCCREGEAFPCSDVGCKKCWLDWLKQGAT